ncbi:MAG: hypothetical protein N838_24150 [Thiohalocapsa sp. PB-PSB1]|nr:MAG: hypothetical protein N838_24150 [Thiohalocapsa sp. PB-PSB1]
MRALDLPALEPASGRMAGCAWRAGPGGRQHPPLRLASRHPGRLSTPHLGLGREANEGHVG